jgi:predicted phosphate transport protein (TIGR00153 family)
VRRPLVWNELREQVDQDIMALFGMVIQSIHGGTMALLAQDSARADQLVAEDRSIDRHCEALTGLIREHLAGVDDAAHLELLIGILQLVPELERSADLGEHIAQRARGNLAAALDPRARGDIQTMNDLAARMWESAADAYIDRSRDAGFSLTDADDELDELSGNLVRQVVAAGADANTAAEVAIIARFYERLGDHAVNVARRIDAMAGPRRGAAASHGIPAIHLRAGRLAAFFGRLRRLRVAPADGDFFRLFRAAAVNARDCAEELRRMISELSDTDAHYAEIRRYERAGDQITIELQRKLDSSFVTPYDREDIHALAEELDDVVDDMFAVAELIHLVRVGQAPAEFSDLADILVAMATETVDLVECMQSRTGERYRLEKVESLEREGDALYRRLMARLFSGEYEALEVLKWKDIVQALEDSLNTIEDVSDVIESILVKDS